MQKPNQYSLRQAARYLQAGRKESASDILLRVVDIDPRSEEGWYLLSFALENREHQRHCLRRVLKINPKNIKAQTRLARLASADASPGVVPKKRKRPKGSKAVSAPKTSWFTWSFGKRANNINLLGDIIPVKSVLVGAGAFVMLCLLLATLLNMFFKQQEPAAQPVTGDDNSLVFDEVIPVDLEGVSLPIESAGTLAGLESVESSPVSTSLPVVADSDVATPSPTQVLAIPAPELWAEIQLLQEQVVDVRGLEALGQINHYIVTDGSAEVATSETGLTLSPEDETHVLEALGLIRPSDTYPLLQSDNMLGATYVPDKYIVLLPGEGFTSVGRFIYAHEYGRVLIDQHFDIRSLDLSFCASDQQRCQAISALIEGDASLTMAQWLAQATSPEDQTEIELAQYDPLNRVLDEEDVPVFLVEDANFPAVAGLNFVQALYEIGNWEMVNAAYANLPVSTEQILHPDKYLAGEIPLVLTPVGLDLVIASQWRLLTQDVLGEWKTYLLLAFGATVRLDKSLAAEAAAGWHGDVYQVYYNDMTGGLLLTAHWAWDTDDDAQEFLNAMRMYQDARFRVESMGTRSGECWQATAQVSCIISKDQSLLWILAPDTATLTNVLAQYTDFP